MTRNRATRGRLTALSPAELARASGGDALLAEATAPAAYEPAHPEFTYQKIVWADQKKSQ